MASPDDRLALSVTDRNGVVTRWGYDETDTARVPDDLDFSTSIPGGFKDSTINLLRRYTDNLADLNLYDSVRIYGPGNQTAWEGRAAQFPATIGDTASIKPGFVGWAAHLMDDKFFREIYVDIDKTHWTGPSVQRKLNLLTATIDYDDPSVTQDASTGQAALTCELAANWARARRVEAWYDANGVSIGSLGYAWKIGATISAADTSWSWLALLGTDDILTASDSSAELRAAGPGTGTLTATTATRKFALLLLAYDIAITANDGKKYPLFWTAPAVYGTHGLTKQGTASATEAQGFYASDMIADAVSRAAPLLTYTTGSEGSIQPSGFVIPHAEFKEPTTVSAVIERMNAYHLWDHGVYDNREFFFRLPDPGRLRWVARLSDGAKFDSTGDQADDIYNGVVVTYQTADGQTKTAGPTGSGADVTSDLLADLTAENPVNAHGIPRRWAELKLSVLTTDLGATTIGAAFLAERSLSPGRGSINLTGRVEHPTEGMVPVWQIRAGDFITVADLDDFGDRRIIETRYTHSTRTLSATLESTPFKIEALLERLGIQLTGVLT